MRWTDARRPPPSITRKVSATAVDAVVRTLTTRFIPAFSQFPFQIRPVTNDRLECLLKCHLCQILINDRRSHSIGWHVVSFIMLYHIPRFFTPIIFTFTSNWCVVILVASIWIKCQVTTAWRPGITSTFYISFRFSPPNIDSDPCHHHHHHHPLLYSPSQRWSAVAQLLRRGWFLLRIDASGAHLARASSRADQMLSRREAALPPSLQLSKPTAALRTLALP